MFKSVDLSLIVEFMLMFYKDKPIDWLLDHIMWVKVCNPEKDAVSSTSPMVNLGPVGSKPFLICCGNHCPGTSCPSDPVMLDQ